MNMHCVHNLVKKLENNGIVIRRAGGTHLMARNPKTGKTYTISMKRINRLGTDKEFEHASKILLKSAAQGGPCPENFPVVSTTQKHKKVIHRCDFFREALDKASRIGYILIIDKRKETT